MNSWVVKLRDGRTCEVVADEAVNHVSGAAQFIQLIPDEGRSSVLVSFARGQWLEVARTDAAVTWHPTRSAQPPRFA